MSCNNCDDDENNGADASENQDNATPDCGGQVVVRGCAAQAIVVNNCGCGSGRRTTECCGHTPFATPRPYGAVAPLCTQDHTKTTIYETYNAGLRIENEWNVPECVLTHTDTATLSVPGLVGIIVGSFLWHPSYGYFEVTAFNPVTQEVTVKNNCTDGNAPAGTTVPACTFFLNVDTPGEGGGIIPPSSNYPYLALDFTAPAVSSCIEITLTTTQGLAVGKNVQIASATYRLSAISSATLATICNDGLGAIPGTPVYARDSNGNLQYPVILIDTNACTNEPVTTGTLLVCKDGLSQPLDGLTVGMVPVLIDETTNTVQMKLLDVPVRVCTALISTLTLVPAQASYVLTVGSTDGFVVTDILQLGNTTPRLTVTNVNDGSHLTVTYTPTPSAFATIPIGTSLCKVSCCETAVSNLSFIGDAETCGDIGTDFAVKSISVEQTGNTAVVTVASAKEHNTIGQRGGGGSLSVGSIDISSSAVYTNVNATYTATITNPDDCRSMKALICATTEHLITLQKGGTLLIQPQITLGSDPVDNLVNIHVSTVGQTDDFTYQETYRHSDFFTVTIPPSSSYTVLITGKIVTTVDFDPTATWTNFKALVTVLASTMS